MAATRFILSIILVLAMVAEGLAQTLTIATYNIRYDNSGDAEKGDGWQQRSPVVASLIRFHDFDIFGTQEAKINQLRDLDQALPGYARIGVGRDDGKEAGEFSAIFYKTERFTLVNEGHFWLAETTDRPVKGWDAALPRICSWGEFEDKQSGRHFLFYNIHFDHIGVKARSESARLILQKIKEQAGDKPVILTGDFNVDQHNESYALLNQSGVLRDAYELAAFRYAQNGTFNNFDANAATESRIDHIFLGKAFGVQRYGILTDTYRTAEGADGKSYTSGNFPKEVKLSNYKARVPSDHFPVMVRVTMP